MCVGYVKGIIEVSCEKDNFSCNIIADGSEILYRNAVCNYDSVVLRHSSGYKYSNVLAIKLDEGNRFACRFDASVVSQDILVALASQRRSIYWKLEMNNSESNGEKLGIVGYKIAND